MGEDAVVKDQREYIVVKDQDVRLTVKIGDKQIGGSSLVIDSTPVATGPNGQVSNLVLGTGDKIRYKLLQCTTTVKDVSPETNKTSVIYMFRGGESDQDFPYNVEVKTEGGYATYLISFLFL